MRSQKKLGERQMLPNRFSLLLAFLVIIGMTVVTFVGAVQIAPHADEITYTIFFQTLLNGLVPSGGDPQLLESGHGALPLWVQHAVGIALGQEMPGEFLYTPGAIASHHIGVALMGSLTVFAAGIGTSVITKSWRWGVIGSLVLVALPVWAGHSMFNSQDVGAALGYTLFTVSVAGYLATKKRTPTRLGLWFSVAVLAFAITLGSRPGLWPFLILTVVIATFALIPITSRKQIGLANSTIDALVLLAGTAFAFAAGYLIAYLTYPSLFGNPANALLDPIIQSARYPFQGSILFAGNIYGMPPPRFVIPGWFMATFPILLGIFFAIGSAWTIIRFCRFLFARESSDAGLDVARVVVLMQVISVPSVGILLGSNIYSIRHLLFVLPAAAMTTTVGLVALMTRLRRQNRQRTVKATVVVFSVGIALPSLAQLQLFPYSYSYYNEALTLSGIDQNWPTDQWRASSRELLSRTPPHVPYDCEGSPGIGIDFCREFADFQLDRALVGSSASSTVVPFDEYVLIKYAEFDFKPPEGCQELERVGRTLLTSEITLGSLSSCPYELTEIPAGGLDASLISDGERTTSPAEPFLLWGWGITPDLGVWSDASSAGLGFELPSRLEDQVLSLQIEGFPLNEGASPRDLTFTVNGAVIGSFEYVTPGRPETLDLTVPKSVVEKGLGALIIEISVTDKPEEAPIFFLQGLNVSPKPNKWAEEKIRAL